MRTGSKKNFSYCLFLRKASQPWTVILLQQLFYIFFPVEYFSA
ncbi:hypothetical protein PI172_0002 [Prevotella intermedia]|uniref:Uncharacterized protein n=1 Tax=Prevotella intermedia TaxID=28131 RepID=A0AAD1F5Z5_PREIN|nr:hypothetical protein PI172_0002 [Prevotella intermedia]